VLAPRIQKEVTTVAIKTEEARRVPGTGAEVPISAKTRLAIAGRGSYLKETLGLFTSRDVSELVPIPRFFDGQLKLEHDLGANETVTLVALVSSSPRSASRKTARRAAPVPFSWRSTGVSASTWYEGGSMRRSALGLLLACALGPLACAGAALGCASASATPSPAAESVSPAQPAVDAGASAVIPPPPSTPDAAPPAEAGLPDAGYPLTYRNSLSVCWTDGSCRRALTVAHGGDWSYTGNPYDSNAALAAAVADGVDGVKIDARMTKDNVAVVAHSSPFSVYESLDCLNKKVEEMTAAEVTKCHRVPSSTETYQRLDDVLNAMRGKVVVQICVKAQADTGAIAAAVLAAGAQDFAFLEISTSDLQTLVPPIPNGNKLWYLISVSNVSEVDTLLGTIKNPRAFMYEFDPSVSVATLVSTRLHPAGIRSFTYDKPAATSADVKARFDQSFDVVSTNAAVPAVQARIQVNTAAGVSPP
jgi:glycerophosphoryl diester phosphodiesterase